MAVKYFVDPGLQQDFVDAWLKMYDESRDEKGLNVIELTKVRTWFRLWSGTSSFGWLPLHVMHVVHFGADILPVSNSARPAEQHAMHLCTVRQLLFKFQCLRHYAACSGYCRLQITCILPLHSSCSHD